jgi:hypothetical protein
VKSSREPQPPTQRLFPRPQPVGQRLRDDHDRFGRGLVRALDSAPSENRSPDGLKVPVADQRELDGRTAARVVRSICTRDRGEVLPRRVVSTSTILSASPTPGTGSSHVAWTTVKSAVLTPIPTASDSTAMSVKARDLARRLSAPRNSCPRSRSHPLANDTRSDFVIDLDPMSLVPGPSVQTSPQAADRIHLSLESIEHLRPAQAQLRLPRSRGFIRNAASQQGASYRVQRRCMRD